MPSFAQATTPIRIDERKLASTLLSLAALERGNVFAWGLGVWAALCEKKKTSSLVGHIVEKMCWRRSSWLDSASQTWVWEPKKVMKHSLLWLWHNCCEDGALGNVAMAAFAPCNTEQPVRPSSGWGRWLLVGNQANTSGFQGSKLVPWSAEQAATSSLDAYEKAKENTIAQSLQAKKMAAFFFLPRSRCSSWLTLLIVGYPQ